MINIQVTCDLCGEKSDEFTPMDEEKTVKTVCEDSEFIVGVKRCYFSHPKDLCVECFKVVGSRYLIKTAQKGV